jgi:uncharacterized membrane protein YfhO
MAKPRGAVPSITASLAILVGLGLLACCPIVVHGAPDLSWDGAAHAVWAQQFASQFWQGDWYPRWFANINAGYGGPSGFFYPPLTNYASSIFWPLVAARSNAGWLSSGYSLVLAFTLSGIAAYLWLRSLTSARAALLGAIVYLLAPYHLSVDLYLRGASAELWVFVWLPLVMLSSEELLRRSRWAVPVAAITFALAIFSHPSTAACFAAVAVAYVIFMSPGRERIRQTSIFVAALLLGVGLDAVYLLPAVLDQHKASVARYTSGLADYRNNWVLPWRGEISSGAHYLLARFAGATATLPIGVAGYVFILLVTLSTMLAIALLFLLARRAGGDGRIRRIAAFYALVALVAFFFMTKASALLWSLAGFLKYLQFPSRLNVILALCLAALAALAAPYLLQPRTRAATLLLALVAVGWLAADAWSPTHVYSAWGGDPVKSNLHWVAKQLEPFDMMPQAASERVPKDTAEFDRFVEAHPPKAVRIEAPSGHETTSTAFVESWQPRRVQFEIHSSQESQLTINHFYYQGWQGRVAGAKGTLIASPSPEGFIQLTIPQGDYELVLELPRDRAERVGSLVSLLCVVMIAELIGRAWRRDEQRTDPSLRS